MTAESSPGAAGEGAGGPDPRADDHGPGAGSQISRVGAEGLDAQGRRPGGLGRDIFGQETDLCTDHMVAGPFTVPSYDPEGLVELVRAAQRADQRHPKWWTAVPRSQASLVVDAADPGPSLATLLAAETDPVSAWKGADFPPEADDGTLVEMAAACERMAHHYTALQARFVQGLAERRSASVQAVQSLGDEIGARLGVSSYAGGRIVTRAVVLADSPRVADALTRGLISARKVDIILAAMSGLEEEQAETLEDLALEVAPTLTPPELKKKLAEAVLVQDPEAAEERHQALRAQRYVSCQPVDGGMAWFGAYLPVEDAAAAFTCIDTMAAHRAEGDDRGIDARRADAFTQIFTEALATGCTPGGERLPLRQGVPAHLRLVITAPVLAGDAQTPALLHGFGPITAPAARRLIGERGCAEVAMRCRSEGGLVGAPRRDDDLDGAPRRDQNRGSFRRGRRQSPTCCDASREDVRPERGAQPAGVDECRSVPFRTGYPGVLAGTTPPGELAFGSRAGPDGDQLFRYCPPAWPAHLPDGTDPLALVGWVRKRRGVQDQRDGPREDECAFLERELGLITVDSYAPSRRLRRRIVERDQVCRFPGCQVPGWRCQLDHIVPFDSRLPAWAQTVETNLHLLCAHHHQLKTAGVFQVEREVRTGLTTWHARTGHVYVRGPEPADLAALEAHLRADLDANRCTKRYARLRAQQDRTAERLGSQPHSWSTPLLDEVVWIDPMSPPRTRRSGRTDCTDRTDRSARSERTDRTERPGRTDRPEGVECTDGVGRTAEGLVARSPVPGPAWPEADSEPPY